MEQEEVDIPVGGHRGEDPQVAGGQSREPEHRDAFGEIEERAVLAQPSAGGRQALGGTRESDPPTQATPELGLPTVISAGRPADDRLGPVDRIAVEEVGHMAQDGEPSAPADRVGRVGAEPEVRRECV